ncbi:DUF4956 domain-containing protein, partial [Cellulomonas septica]
MTQLTHILTDLVAVTLLAALYFHRHRRRDLVAAFVGVNVGVLAVASTMATSGVAAGLGLGLFGVLSIIRLRSTEIDQGEVAYYFSALALGILGALPLTTWWQTPALMALILVAILVGDHPRLLRRHHRQEIVLDGAVTDPVALVARVEQLLGARVHSVSVQRVDLVNDTTWVDVRYETAPPPRPGAPARNRRHAAGRVGATHVPGE